MLDKYTILIEEVKSVLINGKLKLPNDKLVDLDDSNAAFDGEYGTVGLNTVLDCYSQYQELYYGIGYTDNGIATGSTLMINDTIGSSFGVLKIEEPTSFCNHPVFSTFYDNIFVLELGSSFERYVVLLVTFFCHSTLLILYMFIELMYHCILCRIPMKKLNPTNIGLHTLVSSTANFVAYQGRMDLEETYRTWLAHECMQNRQILKLKLEIIRANPESIHLLFEGKPGMAASLRGDVLQVMKCEEVDPNRIKLRGQLDACYKELPIFVDSEPKFLTKSNGIIVDSSSVVKCGEESSIHLIPYKRFVKMQNRFSILPNYMTNHVVFFFLANQAMIFGYNNQKHLRMSSSMK